MSNSWNYINENISEQESQALKQEGNLIFKCLYCRVAIRLNTHEEGNYSFHQVITRENVSILLSSS